MIGMIALALIAAPVAPAPDLPLDEIAGVRLDETDAAVMDYLRQSGPVERTPEGNGAIAIKAGDTNITICEGHVVHVDRNVGTSFHEFARSAGVFLKVHGAPNAPDIFAIDAARPASDPRGAAKVSLSTIRLTWAKAPHFILGLSEVNGRITVFIALNETSRCEGVVGPSSYAP
ncbi:MAG TPA: hypothetical protein VFW19_02285 [Allosphingosinicella sp.]|nr:hypothetical protein [Allosphingosinicella sp.]